MSWAFEVDYNDHFETPLDAYLDLLPFLSFIAKKLNKDLKDLVIYDPFYCMGAMVSRLHSLGCENVINENRDFYDAIDEKTIPAYDVLVTNPPYSGEHKPRLLRYLQSTSSPFALLLPAYTASKNYWKHFVEAQGNRTPLYLLPPDSYSYDHPEGTGKEVPPFYSAWFFSPHILNTTLTKEELLDLRVQLCRTQRIVRGSRNASYDRRCRVVSSISELAERGLISESKRGNPKQRKKKQNRKK